MLLWSIETPPLPVREPEEHSISADIDSQSHLEKETLKLKMNLFRTKRKKTEQTCPNSNCIFLQCDVGHFHTSDCVLLNFDSIKYDHDLVK